MINIYNLNKYDEGVFSIGFIFTKPEDREKVISLIEGIFCNSCRDAGLNFYALMEDIEPNIRLNFIATGKEYRLIQELEGLY